MNSTSEVQELQNVLEVEEKIVILSNMYILGLLEPPNHTAKLLWAERTLDVHLPVAKEKLESHGKSSLGNHNHNHSEDCFGLTSFKT